LVPHEYDSGDTHVIRKFGIGVVVMWKDFRNNTPENGVPAMDHDKPQAVTTYADEAVFSEDRTVSPLTVDVDYAHHPSLDEPVIIEEKRERRGEALWYVLCLSS
jgi:hypothetical protein